MQKNIRKIKKLYIKNKKVINTVLVGILALIFVLTLYKMLFYSNSQKAIYGQRLSDIGTNKISNKKIKEFEKEFSKIDKLNEVKIKVKGRLIKYFIYINSEVSLDTMKEKANKIVESTDENIKGYYDLEFYFIQNVEGNEKYPLIGYKHKNNSSIFFSSM